MKRKVTTGAAVLSLGWRLGLALQRFDWWMLCS